MKKIRVLIIDDSAVVRKVLTEILSADKHIEVVGTAIDPYIARDKIKKYNPDVLTLDIEMPKMDGISFLRNLMRLRPMPVVMISSLTEAGSELALEALELGAIDIVSKPRLDVAHQLEDYASEIIEKIKSAASARVQPGIDRNKIRASTSLPKKGSTKHRKTSLTKFDATEKIICIGASTGGTEAIKDILMNMQPDSPATIIAQHIPAAFSGAFARRMDGLSAMAVTEAEDGQRVMPGCAYIAPGDKHMMLVRDGARYYIKLTEDDPVNRHRPSVDVMFRSVSESAGVNAVGIILTGMGADGAQGLKEMREAGAKTIAQDEKTSVVWGMPGVAVKLDAADYVLPLSNIASKVDDLLRD